MIRHIFLWNVTPEAGAEGWQLTLDALNRIKDEPVPAAAWTVGRDLQHRAAKTRAGAGSP